jgi:hypothetical protein
MGTFFQTMSQARTTQTVIIGAHHTIISIILDLWNDERNRLSMNVVKAHSCCKVNFKKSCSEFAEWVKKQRSTLEHCFVKYHYKVKYLNSCK